MFYKKFYFIFKVVASIALAFSASLSQADEQDTLNFTAGVTSRYDDNLFRRASNEQSEVINSLYASIRLDKQYSLQKIHLEAQITRNQYRNFDQLDWNNKQYGASWAWAITPRLTGTLSANRSESIVNFNDILVNTTNPNSINQIIQSNRNEAFLMDYNAFGGWHLLGGVSRQEQKNSQAFNQNPTFTSKSADLGVRYDFRSGSQLTVMNHTRRGENDDRAFNPQTALFDNSYKENETEVTLNWLLTAKSTVNANLGYYKRENDNLSVWDFSGFQGGLAYEWTPTGKLSVNVSLTSQLGTFQSLDINNIVDNSYTRTTTFSIRPEFQYSPKISFNGNLSVSKRSFEGDKDSQITNPTSREQDKLYSAGLGMQWRPYTSTALGINFAHQKNDSNNDLFDYKAKSATLSGSFTF